MGYFAWGQNESSGSASMYMRLRPYIFSVENPALDSTDRYRALYDRNGNRLDDIRNALDKWDTLLVQIRQQLLGFRHLFQQKFTVLDLLQNGTALKKGLKNLDKETRIEAAARDIRYTNVMDLTLQFVRLRDLIAEVFGGIKDPCAIEMQNFRRAYEADPGINVRGSW